MTRTFASIVLFVSALAGCAAEGVPLVPDSTASAWPGDIDTNPAHIDCKGPCVPDTDGGQPAAKPSCSFNDQFGCTAKVAAYGQNVNVTIAIPAGVMAGLDANRTDCTLVATPFLTEFKGGGTITISLSCPRTP